MYRNQQIQAYNNQFYSNKNRNDSLHEGGAVAAVAMGRSKKNLFNLTNDNKTNNLRNFYKYFY